MPCPPRQARREDGAGGRRKPDSPGIRLAVGQHCAVAVNVLPLEPQRLGLARAGVEQEAQRGDGDRPFRLRHAVERPTERGELVVRQVVRQVVCFEACLAPPQSLARVRVLAPQSECFRVLHHRRQRRERPVRRTRIHGRNVVVPVAHVLRADRIDRAVAEGRQYPAPHGVRVAFPRRGLPPLGAVGEERRRERPHRWYRRRRAVRFGIGHQRARRVPCILDRQRIQRAECPLDDRAVAAPVHDPCLAPVRSRPQSEPRCRAVPQYGLASVRSGEGARARHRDLRSVRHVPIPPVRFGRDRRVAGVPVGEHPGHAG